MISSVHIYAFATIAVQLTLFAVALVQCRKKKKSAPLPRGPSTTNKNPPQATANASNPSLATANAPNPALDSKPADGGNKKEEPKKNSKDAKKAKPKDARKQDKSIENVSKTGMTDGQTDAEDEYQEAQSRTVGTVTNENTVDGNNVEARDKFSSKKEGKSEKQKENNACADGGKPSGSAKAGPKKSKPQTPSDEQDPFAKPSRLPKSKTEDADQNVASLYPKHA